MDILTGINERKSIRGYLNKEVEADLISKILSAATRSPSATNIQPWHIYAVTGEALERIKIGNKKEFLSQADPTMKEPPIEGVYKLRRQKLAKDLFNLLEIKREDKAKRRNWTLEGYGCFDAPALLVISTKDNLLSGVWSLLAIGSLIQSICLVSKEYGLGTCISEQSVAYHNVIKGNLPLEEDETIIIGITLGYEDNDFPGNSLISERAPVEDVLTFVK